MQPSLNNVDNWTRVIGSFMARNAKQKINSFLFELFSTHYMDIFIYKKSYKEFPQKLLLGMLVTALVKVMIYWRRTGVSSILLSDKNQ